MLLTRPDSRQGRKLRAWLPDQAAINTVPPPDGPHPRPQNDKRCFSGFTGSGQRVISKKGQEAERSRCHSGRRTEFILAVAAKKRTALRIVAPIERNRLSKNWSGCGKGQATEFSSIPPLRFSRAATVNQNGPSRANVLSSSARAGAVFFELPRAKGNITDSGVPFCARDRTLAPGIPHQYPFVSSTRIARATPAVGVRFVRWASIYWQALCPTAMSSVRGNHGACSRTSAHGW